MCAGPAGDLFDLLLAECGWDGAIALHRACCTVAQLDPRDWRWGRRLSHKKGWVWEALPPKRVRAVARSRSDHNSCPSRRRRASGRGCRAPQSGALRMSVAQLIAPSLPSAGCRVRYNRRRTKGVGRIASRTIAQLVAHGPWTMRQIVNETAPYRMFPNHEPELAA